MWGPRIFGALPRRLTVVGDPTTNDDLFTRAVALGDYIYAFGQNILVKFDAKLNVLAKANVPVSDAYGLATDGTYLYVTFQAYSASYTWGVRIMKFDLSLALVSQTALEASSGDDYPRDLLYAGGYLYHVSGTRGTGSAPWYIRLNVAKINPSTLAVVANRSYYGSTYEQHYRARWLASGNILGCGVTKGSYYAGYVGIWDTTPAMLSKVKIGGDASNCSVWDGAEEGGNIFCVGQAGTKALLLKLDSSLTVLAQKVIGGANTSCLNTVVADGRGNLVACGSTTELTSGANYDCFGVKFDTSLNVLEQFALGSTGNDYLEDSLLLGGSVFMFGRETGRNTNSNGLALRMPSALSSAKVSGVSYLTEKACNLAVAASSLTVATPTFSTAVETWSNWSPGLSASDYTSATVDQGKI